MTPEEREIIGDFLNELAREEENLHHDIRLDRVGLAFRTAINELDWYVWNYRHQQEPTEEQEEQYYLISLGVARLVLLSMQIHRGYPVPALTFRRERRLYSEVLSLVSHLGFIQHGRRVSDPAFAGFCQVTRGPEGRYHRDQAPVEYVLNNLKFSVIQTRENSLVSPAITGEAQGS